MKLTHYGCREWLGSGLIAFTLAAFAGIAYALQWIPLGVFVSIAAICLIVWACIAAFFRDPERSIPSDPAFLLSPADGVVRDIELIKNESVECEELRNLFQGRDMLRVGIFLSVFNVHLNRAPIDFCAVFKFYKKGAYHDARDGRASKENESMILGGNAAYEDVAFPLAVKQVSGAIARRIVCPVEPGDRFQRGQRYGMIKFGSRTELYLPAGCGIDVTVKVGDPVQGATTVIAKILPGAKEKILQWQRSSER